MDPEAFFGMMIGFGLVVVLPITAILTSHQRKMAELMARRPQNESNQADQARITRLESELYELKQMLQGHIIATDQMLTRPDVRQNPVMSQPERPTPPLPEDVRAKLG